MNLQDRAFAAGILVIMGLCCLGSYVAFSGFINAGAPGVPSEVSATTVTSGGQAGSAAGKAPTDDSSVFAPPTFFFGPTVAALPSPSADIPTVTPIVTGTVTETVLPGPTSTSASGCGYLYCARRGGPPTTQAPTGNPCPSSYIWGFVLGSGGQGQPGMKVQFATPSGEGNSVYTKGPPDPPGRWDVPAASGSWTFQLVDAKTGRPLSPAVSVQARTSDPSGKTCPTRLDFVQ